ncbi:MAG: signal peptide peptidase SppA [Desulfobacterales bacterium]|nr:MAG: signal peptide peptidase SppA [Desulfobacterales bacterium]
MRTYLTIVLSVSILLFNGCTAPRIRLFPSAADPLKEFTLQGKEKGKVLVIPIRGVISDAPKGTLLRTKPSMVQEIVSQLRLAEKDEDIRAVLLKVDSPGGSVTASDVLYHEIMAFKQRRGVKVVAAMMGVAASGGYYISLPADFILAHPTTITGSIGVIFLRPRVTGLMGKIGFDVELNKSGENKDMGSPFRPATEMEERILQDLTDELGRRFTDHVVKHRRLEQSALAEISTARIYLADEALKLGLVDQIGYLNDAVSQAKKLAGLPEDAKIVVYRRTEYPDDNLYNTATTRSGGSGLSLVAVDLPGYWSELSTGFYYLWAPAATDD